MHFRYSEKKKRLLRWETGSWGQNEEAWEPDEEMPICQKITFINSLHYCTILIPYIVKYTQLSSHPLFELVKQWFSYIHN